MKYPVTPDGRYFVVHGRLWRCSDPTLDADERRRLVHELMNARRRVKLAKADDDEAMLRQARLDVNAAKISLGERGPTWWNDETDFNRCLAKNSPYAGWWSQRTCKPHSAI